jgi:hypothetical protein
MRILKTMKPGAKGTQTLAEKFEGRLVCVRYRYDAAAKRRYTTAEIIVAEGDWMPRQPGPDPEEAAWIRVRWDEQDLRARVKAGGGRWDAERRLWSLPAGTVRELGLESRVVPQDRPEGLAATRPPGSV